MAASYADFSGPMTRRLRNVGAVEKHVWLSVQEVNLLRLQRALGSETLKVGSMVSLPNPRLGDGGYSGVNSWHQVTQLRPFGITRVTGIYTPRLTHTLDDRLYATRITRDFCAALMRHQAVGLEGLLGRAEVRMHEAIAAAAMIVREDQGEVHHENDTVAVAYTFTPPPAPTFTANVGPTRILVDGQWVE